MRRFERAGWAAWLAVTACMPVALVVNAWEHDVFGLVASVVGIVCSVPGLWRHRHRWLA